jgi:long-subunit acyl-CoA synthetase (AMP-forming)
MSVTNFQELLEQYSGEMISHNQVTSADEFRALVRVWISHLAQLNNSGQAVGVLAKNSVGWLALDMACACLNIPLVPMPTFFTDEQLHYVVNEAGVCLLVTDDSLRGQRLGFHLTKQKVDTPILMLYRSPRGSVLPGNIKKITFTSGTTGQPKGVCLTEAQELAVAEGLRQATSSLKIKRHLCLLPFSVLLENIAGVYAPMLAGASIVCPTLKETGLMGSASFDPVQCLNTLESYQAESIILLPQMLMALLQASHPSDSRLQSLKFIAVGGGKVPLGLLTLAKWFNLPVYEGYGLSEFASVVCVNTPANQKIGSVGKPIEGMHIRIDSNQEIWIKGRQFHGYLHELKMGKSVQEIDDEWFPTGDIGKLDEDGFLTIHGRKSNLIITGFGRNISPEWPEEILLSTGLFIQAVVFGEGQTGLSALLVPRDTQNISHLAEVLSEVNSQLPDYARIEQHLLVNEPFSFKNGFCTANGRIRRDVIWQAYQSQLNGELA